MLNSVIAKIMLWLPVSCRSIICFSLQLQHRLRAVSLFSSVSHTCEGSSRGEAVSARCEKRERQPEKRKERLPAQPVSQWNMCWPHNAKIRLVDAWSVDNKMSTSWWWLKHCRNVCHVSRKHWHSNSRAQWSIRSSYLQSWRYCNFADWFWKKPHFSIVLWEKARYEPKCVHFSGCPVKQHRGRSDQCKMKLTTLLHFRFSLSTFYVASLLFMKGTSCCVLRSCYGKV